MLYGDERRKTHPVTILYNGVVPAFGPGPGFLSDLSKDLVPGTWDLGIEWRIENRESRIEN